MKRIINYIKQWMALRKREEAVAELEREMQDRMTCIDEKMALAKQKLAALQECSDDDIDSIFV